MSNNQAPDPELIQMAMSQWGFEKIRPSFIRGNENYVYEYGSYILRFTGKYHRTPEEIEAELHWINDLAEKSLSVSAPIKSTNRNLLEKLSDTWTCSVFKKASGGLLKDNNQFTPEVFKLWGKLTGKLHRETLNYTPGRYQRNQWNQDDGYLLSIESLNNTDPSDSMVGLYRDLLNEMKSFDTQPRCYGLIHGDFHHGNFHYDESEGTITLFDFDDSVYFWFAFDLAVPFASLKFTKHNGGVQIENESLQDIFMESYLSEFDLDSSWQSKVDFFIKYRFTNLYFWAKGRADHGRVNSKRDTQAFMDSCRNLANSIKI